MAIVLIVLLFFRRGWWPHGAVLGEVPALGGWHSTARYPEATELPGIVVYRWEAPLFFANSGQFRDQVRALARERTPAWIVLQCEAITDIDVTAAEVLKALDEELNDREVHLAFVELRDRLQDLVRRYGLHTTLDQEHFYPSLDQALDAISHCGPGQPSAARRRDDALMSTLSIPNWRSRIRETRGWLSCWPWPCSSW